MDYTKTPADVWVALINAKNPGRNFTTSQLSFGAVSSQGGKASQTTVTAVPGSGYTGSKVLSFGRLNIDTDVLSTGIKEFELGNMLQLSDVVGLINAAFNINLVAGEDYTDAALPTFGDTPGEEQEVTLTMLAGSRLFIGAATLTIRKSEVPLEDAITNGDLGDLEYP